MLRKEEKHQQQDAPASVVETTNILAKCEGYHNGAQGLFDNAFREVNDAKT
jgi:hypothetical protein